MKQRTDIALIALALAVGGSTASAQALLLQDDFSSPTPDGWTVAAGSFPGQIGNVNGQLVVSGNFSGATPVNNPVPTHHTAVIYPLQGAGGLLNHQTLEIRADLVSVNQNGAFAGVALVWLGGAYSFFKDEDEVILIKVLGSPDRLAGFVYEYRRIKNQSVVLVLALTRQDTALTITTRVLDKENANAILFERTVTDTSLSDAVLSSGALKGLATLPDALGTPWPISTPTAYAEVNLTWIDTQRAPPAVSQVVFDNVEVWQYDSPQLAIQSAVVLSWPAAQSLFILESATNVTGSWTSVPNPWCRTNDAQIEVSVPAPDSMKLFRLRFAP